MTEQILLQVGGMTCTGCEVRLQKVLGRLDGVRGATADHRAGDVQVLFDREQTSPQAIYAAITEAGYEINRDVEGPR
jgi:copper chaperone